MDMKSKFGIIYDKKQLDEKIAEAKTQIESGLKVKFSFSDTDSSAMQKSFASMQSQLSALSKKVDEQVTKRKQLTKVLDDQATASKNLATWQARLDKQQVRNEGFLSGGTSEAQDAQIGISNVTKAMDAYGASASKVNKLKVQEEFAKLSVPMASANKHIFSMSEMLGHAAKKFAAFMSVTQVAWMAMRAFKQMYENVKELDSSLIELQKVSDLTGSSLDTFVNRVYESANVLGRTGTQLIDAITSFRRAGYELSESFELGESALLMMNIGDGIDSVDTASKVLISTLKAFNLEASDSTEILDKINEVSNTSAVSFSDLSEGLRIASSTLASSGEDLSSTIGLLTATNVVMQDMSTSANALKVISLRLRG